MRQSPSYELLGESIYDFYPDNAAGLDLATQHIDMVYIPPTGIPPNARSGPVDPWLRDSCDR